MERTTDSFEVQHFDTSGMVKVILIGETGSGKSTFINYLTNFFKHDTLNNLKVAIPTKFHPQVTENYHHHEHDLQDRTQPKTDSCNRYMFTDSTAQYLFIDTPGLCDTRKIEQDAINMRKIIEAIENLDELTAVILIINGAVARVTVNLRNVITHLRGNLPDIVMDNVIVILTNTTRHAANFSLTVLELNGNVYPYYMQNSAFSTDPSKWTESAIVSLQRDWDYAMNQIKAIVETLNTFKVKSVSAFKVMKDIQNEIKELVHQASLDVSEIQKVQDEITIFELQLKKAQADTVTYQDHTRDRIVVTVEVIDAPYYSMLCRNCDYVCHDNCGLTVSQIPGSQFLQQCWAMADDHCTQCRHKCSYTAHYHAKKTDKIMKKKMQYVLDDIKCKFDSALKDSVDLQNKISSMKTTKKKLEKALMEKNEDIKTKCHELRSICSNFNLSLELHALIDQLEAESSMLTNIDAKQQADISIRNLKALCTTIEIDENYQRAKNNLPKPMMNIINTERPMKSFTSTTKNTVGRASNMQLPDSSRHANNDVLNQLQAQCSQQSQNKITEKTQNNTTQNDENSDDQESITESDHNEDESYEEDTPAAQIKIKRIETEKSTTTPFSTASPADSEQSKALTLNELPNRYPCNALHHFPTGIYQKHLTHKKVRSKVSCTCIYITSSCNCI